MMRERLSLILTPLGLILTAAVVTRLWGIGFGLPDFVFYIDEDNIVRPALKIIETLDPNPHRFLYPSLYIYLQSVVFAIYYVFRGLPVWYPGIEKIPVWEFYLLGRMVSAAIAVATIYLVYKVGEELFDRRVGLLSAAAMSGTFVYAVQSHYAKNDIPMVLFGLLSFYFSFQILKGEGRRTYILAGLSAGLATATAYNGALFIVPPLTAHLLSRYKYKEGPVRLTAGLLLLLLPAVGGFLLGCPYCLLSPSEFAAAPWSQRTLSFDTLKPADILVHMSPLDGTPSWLWYIQYLWSSGLYYPISIATFGGLILSLRPRRENILLLSFPIFYAVSLLPMGELYRTDRLTLPLIPFFALYSGYFLSRALSYVSRLKTEKAKALSAVLLFAFFIALPIGRVLLFDLSIAGPDTRQQAEAWFQESVPQDNVIFMWGGSPMLIGHRLRAGNYTNIINSLHFYDKLFQFSGEMVVISESEFNIAKNYRNDEEYVTEYEHYKALFERGRLLKEFSNPFFKSEFFSPVVLEHSSTVNNYHNPTLRIYLLPEGPTNGSRTYRAKSLKEFTEMELVLDNASGDKEALLAGASQRASIKGPYEPIPRGDYTVTYRMKVEDNAISKTVAYVDIRSSTGKVHLETALYGVNFIAASKYQNFTFPLSLQKADILAFRLSTDGRTAVWLEGIELSEPGRHR